MRQVAVKQTTRQRLAYRLRFNTPRFGGLFCFLKDMSEKIFSAEIAEEICERLSDGDPLRQICREMVTPSWRTVYSWIDKYPEFAKSMEVARRLGAHAIAERARGTARGKSGDDGESTGDVYRDKLIIETDLKLLAKWHPKEYGEKIQQEHSGHVSHSDLTDDELNRRIAQLTQQSAKD